MRAVPLLVLMLATAGCAGVGEAVVGTCLAIAVQTACQSCVDIGVGVVCDGDSAHDSQNSDSDGDGDNARPPPPAEIPPPEPLGPPSRCGVKQLDGGVWRLDCVDGTVAEALRFDSDSPAGSRVAVDDGVSTTLPGDLTVSSLQDVRGLSGVRAVLGSVSVTGPALIRLELPSLHSVGRNVAVVDAVHLSTLHMGALIHVGGRVQVVHNPVLQNDPVPALTDAGDVDVEFNDALTPVIVDRLLSIRPRDP